MAVLNNGQSEGRVLALLGALAGAAGMLVLDAFHYDGVMFKSNAAALRCGFSCGALGDTDAVFGAPGHIECVCVGAQPPQLKADK